MQNRGLSWQQLRHWWYRRSSLSWQPVRPSVAIEFSLQNFYVLHVRWSTKNAQRKKAIYRVYIMKTYQGLAMHICINDLGHFSVENWLVACSALAITWATAYLLSGLLSIGPLETNFIGISIKHIIFLSRYCNWKCRLRNVKYVQASLCWNTEFYVALMFAKLLFSVTVTEPRGPPARSLYQVSLK